jgi:hypothetical protein
MCLPSRRMHSVKNNAGDGDGDLHQENAYFAVPRQAQDKPIETRR